MIKNKIFTRYMILMLAVMLVPMSISSIVMIVNAHRAEKQSAEKSRELLVGIERGFLREFDNTQQFALDIALDRDITEFKYDVNKPEKVYELNGVMKKLKQIETMNDMIHYAFLYMPSYDMVLSSDKKSGIKEFYEMVVASDGGNFEEWKNRMDGTYYNTYFYGDNISVKNVSGDKSTIEYLQSYPVAKTSSKTGNVVVVLDCEKLIERYVNIDKKNAALYVLDSNDRVIFGSGEENYSLQEWYKEGKIVKKKGIFSSDTIIKSENNGYKFIYIEADRVANAGMKSVIVINIIGIIMILVLGVCLALFTAYKFSEPVIEINSMINKFRNNDNDEVSKAEGVKEKLAIILKNSENVEKILTERAGILKNNILKRLMYGRLDGITDIKQELERADIHFNFDTFAVIMIDIVSDKSYDNESITLIKYIITKMITESLGRVGNVEFVDDELKEISVIFNFDRRSCSDNQIVKELSSINDFVALEFGMECETDIGEICNGIEGISRSRRGAKECSEYRIYSGTRRILSYSRIKNNDKDAGYFYNAEMENEFIRNVIMGNERAALKSLEDMIAMHENSSVVAARCFFFNLLGAMLKILNSGNIEVAESVDNGCRFAELFACRRMEELREVIKRMVCEICRDINEHDNNRNQKLMRALMDYVENNYSDNSMSLEKVADEFNLNFTYVSHFFKAQMGENFSDYITLLRINKAKELLANTNMSVSEIAIKVGYTNSTVFGRNFKKVENITPGKYRENCTNSVV